ncbi:hypothetical protein H4582DRAFT_1899777 [Lactarius indigo]|nr:hypothetical protein H4582DRAFT_1899777 [Lactarius indigo]
MAKSTRSKVKRAFRAKKRTEGVYAATEAARLQRLNAKLRALTTARMDNDDEQETRNPKEDEEGEDVAGMPAAAGDGDDAEMVSSIGTEGVEAAQKFKGKVSTHGPRGSRREQWRVSKGMAPRPKSKGMNRQGAASARYKSGRPHRRR